MIDNMKGAMNCPHCGSVTRTHEGHSRHMLSIICPRCGSVGWADNSAGIISAALDVCERQQRQPGQDAEFWRRLAGSVRKGLTMLQ